MKEVTILNGFGIRRLRILNTFGNLKCHLTLIREAGGVYDFQNFEEVYLCNGLGSEL